MAEWLPKDHLVWFVLEVVKQLDTAVLHRRHPQAGPGRAGYDPDMLLALLVYAYAVGQRSSRQIERLCQSDVGFRVVCAQDTPDHTTIARFRAVHEDAFADLFARVLVLCAEAGLGRVGTVAIDGTKIAANASMEANRTGAWLAGEARRITAEAAAADAAEDEAFGEVRGDELPAELADPTTRTERIRRALAQVQDKERRAAEDAERSRARAEEYLRAVENGQSPTGRPPEGIDPVRLAAARVKREQTRLAETTDRQQRSNAHGGLGRARRALAKAQAQQQLAEATAAATTAGRGEPTGAVTAARKPRPAKQAKANTTDPDSRMMSTKHGWIQGFNAQIAVSEDHLILATMLTTDPTDTLSFQPMMTAAAAAVRTLSGARNQPEGDREPTADTEHGGIGVVLADAGYLSTSNLTAAGPDRLIALGSNRDLHRDAREHPTAGPPPDAASPITRMRHRLRTPEGEATYKRRGATVEPVIGHLKDQIGLRRFSRRGHSAAASELNVAAAVANLLKLHGRLARAAG